MTRSISLARLQGLGFEAGVGESVDLYSGFRSEEVALELMTRLLWQRSGTRRGYLGFSLWRRCAAELGLKAERVPAKGVISTGVDERWAPEWSEGEPRRFGWPCYVDDGDWRMLFPYAITDLRGIVRNDLAFPIHIAVGDPDYALFPGVEEHDFHVCDPSDTAAALLKVVAQELRLKVNDGQPRETDENEARYQRVLRERLEESKTLLESIALVLERAKSLRRSFQTMKLPGVPDGVFQSSSPENFGKDAIP